MIIIQNKYINKNLLLFLSLLILIFSINLSIEYSKYQELIEEEVFEVKVEVLSLRNKVDKKIAKLRGENFVFFTSFPLNSLIKKNDTLKIIIVTVHISYIDYLKGFYTNNIYFDILKRDNSLKSKLSSKIQKNHKDLLITELFEALFLGTPISSELRKICSNYGISHLIALSGFHLGVLSFLIYWVLYFPYSFFHKRYFPYKNKKYDLLLITIFILFLYLLLTNLMHLYFALLL